MRISSHFKALLFCTVALLFSVTVRAQQPVFKYADIERIPSSVEGLEIISLSDGLSQVLPMKSILKGSLPGDVSALLSGFKSAHIYIAKSDEAERVVREAFAPMLSLSNKSLKRILQVTTEEADIDLIVRQTGCGCWKKYREMLLSVKDGNGTIMIGLTGKFKPDQIKRFTQGLQ